MGFFDDLGDFFTDGVLPIGGAIVGGVLGGPGGAMAGYGAGKGIGGLMHGGGGVNDRVNANAQRQLDLYQNLMGQLPQYEGPQPGQGLTAQDQAAFATAQRNAGQFAQGREQAAMAGDLMRGGGVANSGKMLSAQLQAGQGANELASTSDMNIAAQAADRDRQNRMLLNQFNQQNAFNRMMITGGQAGALQNQSNNWQQQEAVRSGNNAAGWSNMANLGMGIMGMAGKGGGGNVSAGAGDAAFRDNYTPNGSPSYGSDAAAYGSRPPSIPLYNPEESNTTAYARR
jgi:hypothetical protein